MIASMSSCMPFDLEAIPMKVGFSTNHLVSIRLLDIVVGSLFGVLGAWLLHKQYLKAKADRHMRIAKIALLRNR